VAVLWGSPMTLLEKVKHILDKKTLSPESIATKHKVPLDTVFRQLEIGIDVEKEHTTDKKVAREIALDHLGEDPKYYTKLVKIETTK
jgi:hypothetical protein